MNYLWVWRKRVVYVQGRVAAGRRSCSGRRVSSITRESVRERIIGTHPDQHPPVRRLLSRLEIDRAVFLALMLRGWQLAAGAVSVALIGSFFSPDVQGYYYTFASLMALQTFVELGFNIVVLNSSSHEWARLKLSSDGAIIGDEQALSRLVSLGRLVFKWYGWASFLFVVAAGIGGALFLSLDRSPDIAWKSPWIALVLMTGALLWTLPFNALLEGCNQVATVNKYRLIQAICANVVVWTSILLGAELWTAAAATGMRLACDLWLLLRRYRRFFKPFFSSPVGERISWKLEIWPMQWRLAISGVFSYFSYFLFTPVMFHYQGPETAGRMGMSWTLITVLQAAAFSWVQTRAPRFGMLISRREYGELDRLFRRLTLLSLAVVTLGSIVIWSLVYGLSAIDHRFASRLLDPLPTGLFLIAIILFQIPQCQAIYIRAHKQERLLLLNVTSSTAIGLLVWLLGSRYGPTGAACGYLVVIGIYILPAQTILWQRFRKSWRAAEQQERGSDQKDVP